jgi:hypothetical protein
MGGTHPMREIHAIDTRHADIAHQGCHRLFGRGEQLKRLSAGRSFEHLKSAQTQHIGNRHAHERLIVDDEHPWLRMCAVQGIHGTKC